MHCVFCGARYTGKTKATRCPQCERTRDEQIADCRAYLEAHGRANEPGEPDGHTDEYPPSDY